MKRILLLMILILLLGISLYTAKNLNPSTNDVDENFNIKDEYKLLESIKDKNIFLYGKETDFGYDGMILEIGNKKKYTDWKSTFNIISYPPKLILSDIDKDGADELIVILTEAYGTGIHAETIKILDLNTMDEINIIDAIDVIHRNVKSKLTKESIIIETGEKVYSLNPNDYTGHIENLFNNIKYGSEIYFYVKNNKIQARVSAQITHGAYIGYIIINYKYNHNQLVLDSIIFDAN